MCDSATPLFSVAGNKQDKIFKFSTTMGKPTGFLEFTRELPSKRPVAERKNDYNEFVSLYTAPQLNHQAARCMNCGIPFCHHGCPLGNVIPEFNDAVY
jgi:glutamate synthase (NADPH/NADH) small chain